MEKRLMLFLTCLIMSVGLAIAQTQTVKGHVTSDEDGLPVVGASVLVTGTTIGTITDLDGNFTLANVPSSAKTLQVSYVGTQTQNVPIKANMRIVLKADTELLDEVIVVAYGTAKKSAFTGSASVVKADEIGKIQTSNVANALVGKVAGMQITTASGQPGTTTPTIRVRGISSINAGNAPLVILDGIPYDGDLNSINSQDVESMTVLKDAASNALYGARGANGVIIITTKKGKSGAAKVEIDAKWGANSRATQKYKLINDPGQYYETYFGALNSYFVNSLGYSESEAYVLANNNLTAQNAYGLYYNVFNVPSGQYMIGSNGKMNPNATLGNVVTYNGEEFLLRPDNWTNEAYKTSLRQEYNATITAGTDKSSFYASINYLNNEGIVDRSDFERLTGRLNADYQVNDWLKVGANMGYTHYKTNSLDSDTDGSSGSSGNVFAFTSRIAPIYPLYIRDGNGNVKYDSNGIKMYDYGDRGNAGLDRPFLSNSNALSSLLLDTNNANGNAINTTGFFEVRFLKDFKFQSTNNAYIREQRTTTVTNPYYGQYASSNGIIGKYHTRTYAYNYQQLLTYVKEFDVHHVSVLLGHEYYRNKYSYLYGSKSNMFDPNNHELAGAVTAVSQASYTTDYNTEGYFFRGQYDYDETYFASFSYRRDASSRFHPDNRWGNFWSFGAAWNISKESWFNVDWVDALKFKISYGEQGNDNIGDYRYVDTYSIENASGNAAAVPYVKGNKNITWETGGNFNTGFDFELFKGRLSGTAEFFYRKTSDMLFTFPLPPSYGYTYYYANIGDMRNQGVELDLSGTAIKTRDFTLDLKLNLTHYKNKITKLPEERKTMTTSEGVQGFSSGSYFYGEGKSLYTYYMPKYAGVSATGESMFYTDATDADGNKVRETTTDYSQATNYLCGTALPDLYGGFGFSALYKGFDLSMDFVYQIGGQVYDSDYASFMSSPTSTSKGTAFHADVLKSWTQENSSSNIPRHQFGDSYTAATSDRFLTNASYLSLQNINAGYTLPTSVCNTIGLQKMRIYVACDNVWVWSKRQGLDPRQSITGSTTSAYYAPIRTISGGISVSF